MLMTPITPNVMARPIAASSSTEPSESPYQAFCTMFQSARRLSIEVIASTAAFCTAGACPVGRRVRGRLAGRGIEDCARLILDENLVAVEEKASVLQRLDDLERERTATCRHAADCGVGIVETVLGEACERRLIVLGVRVDRS